MGNTNDGELGYTNGGEKLENASGASANCAQRNYFFDQFGKLYYELNGEITYLDISGFSANELTALRQEMFLAGSNAYGGGLRYTNGGVRLENSSGRRLDHFTLYLGERTPGISRSRRDAGESDRVFSPCVKRVPTQRMTAEQAVTTIQEIAPNLVQQGEPSHCQNPFDNIAAPPVAKAKPAPFGYTPPTATFLPTIQPPLPDDTTTMEIPQRQAGFYTPRGRHRLSIQPSDYRCADSFSWNGSALPSKFLFFCDHGHRHDMIVQEEEVEVYDVAYDFDDDQTIAYHSPNCYMM